MRRVFIINAVVSLALGLLIYLFINQDAYISSAVLKIIKIPRIKIDNPILVWIQCFGADLLWSYSLTMTLQAILGLKGRNIWILMSSCILGALYEMGQLTSIINGTFDVVDLLIYLLGSFIAVITIICIQRRKHYEGIQN